MSTELAARTHSCCNAACDIVACADQSLLAGPGRSWDITGRAVKTYLVDLVHVSNTGFDFFGCVQCVVSLKTVIRFKTVIPPH
jgi:hypothetical protein